MAKANENLVETLASHGLLRTQTPKTSQFIGHELKGMFHLNTGNMK